MGNEERGEPDKRVAELEEANIRLECKLKAKEEALNYGVSKTRELHEKIKEMRIEVLLLKGQLYEIEVEKKF